MYYMMYVTPFFNNIGVSMAKLLEKNLMGAEFARQSFRATPPAGTKIEEMLVPEYWAHVARKLSPYDTIEVVPEDGSFYARLFVVNSAKLWAKMHKLEYVELAVQNKAVSTDKYEAKFFGPTVKWRVANKESGDLLSQDSFQTRDEAEAYIEKHNKQMAA